MQPNHLLTDMNWAVDRLGPKRAAYSYAWKAFLDAGVPLAFGTDYPVEPITPFRGLYAAVTRMNEAGTKTYYPENKLTRGQALYAYTQGSAYAEFAEKHKGKLVPGYDADFILVDRDLYKVGAPAHPIHQRPSRPSSPATTPSPLQSNRIQFAHKSGCPRSRFVDLGAMPRYDPQSFEPHSVILNEAHWPREHVRSWGMRSEGPASRGLSLTTIPRAPFMPQPHRGMSGNLEPRQSR